MKSGSYVASTIGGFISRQPWRSMAFLVGAIAAAAAVNFALHAALPNISIGSPRLLPFAQSHLGFSPSGLPYFVVFVLLLLWTTRASGVPGDGLRTWILGLALILLGNLIQGDPDIAFRQPLLASGFQYYHDALRIDSWPSWMDWLGNFNAKQQGLLLHSRTHPPFAVLVHYGAFQLLGERPLRIGLVFAGFSSLCVPLLRAAFAELGLRPEHSSRLAVLLAIIPAVNIFAAVSFDGLIIVACTGFLLGMLILLQRPRFSGVGMLFFLTGILLMNLLSFVGAFAFTVAFLVGAWDFWSRRNTRLLLSTGAALVLFGILLYWLRLVAGYDHLQAFFTAARIENPEGFRLLVSPIDYLATRMECVGEVAFFLSIPVLTSLVQLIHRSLRLQSRMGMPVGIALVAMATLAAMYLAGVNSVGETARSSMFIYPFILLLFWDQGVMHIRDLTILAGLQTAVMQLVGYYFW